MLKQCGLEPLHTILWENDDECCALTSYHFPNAVHMGSIDTTDAASILDALDAADPEGQAAVLITAGPPCPDYTPIKGSSAQGRSGPEGRKFDTLCDLLTAVLQEDRRRATEHLRPARHFLPLIENVVMQPTEAAHFTARLQPLAPGQLACIGCDADSFGLIRRPRLWWLNINWTSLPPAMHNMCKWYHKKSFDHVQIVGLDKPNACWSAAAPIATSLITKAILHPAVLEGTSLLPCLTTPAKDPVHGRTAPKEPRQAISPEAMQRWRDGKQQY